MLRSTSVFPENLLRALNVSLLEALVLILDTHMQRQIFTLIINKLVLSVYSIFNYNRLTAKKKKPPLLSR